ncbi:MAG: hypothetical protein ACRC92_20540 [Peptostreptococcaceae bacterium]
MKSLSNKKSTELEYYVLCNNSTNVKLVSEPLRVVMRLDEESDLEVYRGIKFSWSMYSTLVSSINKYMNLLNDKDFKRKDNKSYVEYFEDIFEESIKEELSGYIEDNIFKCTMSIGGAHNNLDGIPKNEFIININVNI